MSQVNLGLGDGARWFYLMVLRLDMNRALHPEFAYFHPLVEAAWPGESYLQASVSLLAFLRGEPAPQGALVLHRAPEDVRSGDWIWAGSGSVVLEIGVERGEMSLRPLEGELVLGGRDQGG